MKIKNLIQIVLMIIISYGLYILGYFLKMDHRIVFVFLLPFYYGCTYIYFKSKHSNIYASDEDYKLIDTSMKLTISSSVLAILFAVLMIVWD